MDRQRPDVDPEVSRRQVERYRAMSPAEKLACADALWDVVWSATQAGVRMRHPEYSLDEIEQAAKTQLLNARN